MSLSVKRKVTPFPCCPAMRYRVFRSSRRLLLLYVLQDGPTTTTANYTCKLISIHVYSFYMNLDLWGFPISVCVCVDLVRVIWKVW